MMTVVFPEGKKCNDYIFKGGKIIIEANSETEYKQKLKSAILKERITTYSEYKALMNFSTPRQTITTIRGELSGFC